MLKLALNLHKPNNYAFFCPVSRLHLTVSSPVGYTNEVTPAILMALRVETILDVDGVIDLETGTVKGEKTSKESKKAETKAAPVAEPVKEETPEIPVAETAVESVEAEAPVEKPVTKKKGKTVTKDAE